MSGRQATRSPKDYAGHTKELYVCLSSSLVADVLWAFRWLIGPSSRRATFRISHACSVPMGKLASLPTAGWLLDWNGATSQCDRQSRSDQLRTSQKGREKTTGLVVILLPGSREHSFTTLLRPWSLSGKKKYMEVENDNIMTCVFWSLIVIVVR